MKMLVACEFSGTVRDAFAAHGWDAWSCDLLPCKRGGQHLQCDVRDVLGQGWDLMVAHPPCTYLANSGVVWLHRQPGRLEKMNEACRFFSALFHAPVPRVAVENPVMHKHARQQIGVRHSPQVIQPWMFGHTQTKATCLWLRGLPRLQPTHDVRSATMDLPARERMRLYHLLPSPNRWREHSRTYQGVADAMAAQWTDYIRNPDRYHETQTLPLLRDV